jgi:hypothetical protein
VWFVRLAAISFLAFLALANAAAVAEFQHHLRAAGPAIVLGNFSALMMGLACISTVERVSRGAPLDSYAIAVVVGPFLAWVIDVLVINGLVFGHYSF